jgi:hypothetical protein
MTSSLWAAFDSIKASSAELLDKAAAEARDFTQQLSNDAATLRQERAEAAAASEAEKAKKAEQEEKDAKQQQQTQSTTTQSKQIKGSTSTRSKDDATNTTTSNDDTSSMTSSFVSTFEQLSHKALSLVPQSLSLLSAPSIGSNDDDAKSPASDASPLSTARSSRTQQMARSHSSAALRLAALQSNTQTYTCDPNGEDAQAYSDFKSQFDFDKHTEQQ